MVTTRSRNDGTGAGVSNPNANANRNGDNGPTMAEMAELLRSVTNELTRTRAELQEVRADRDNLRNQPERSGESRPRRNLRHAEPSSTRNVTGGTPSVHSSIRREDREVESDGVGLDRRRGGGYGGGDRRNEFKFKTFQDCKPAMFTGSSGPIASMRWIRQIEMTFEACDCPEEKKVVCAAKMLDKEALDWWDTRIQPQGSRYVASLTWDSFVELFKKEFCTEWEMQAMESEFIALQQGDKSIAEYSRAFVEKLRFCKHLCPDDKSQVNRYVSGIPREHRSMVRMQKTLREAIDMAKSIEHDMGYKERKDSGSGFKRKYEGSAGSSSEKKNKSETSKDKDYKKTGTWCNGCKSVHSGACSDKTLRCHKCTGIGHMSKDCTGEARCYTCKQTGHRMADCPQAKTTENKNERPKAQARVYQMVAEEVEIDD